MIYINRANVAPPDGLSSITVKKFMSDAALFYSSGSTGRGQKMFRWKTEPWKLAKPALRTLFRDKCAFCESSLESQSGVVEHFRPKLNALNLDGESSPDHYWWLAVEWTNLYLSCSACNMTKGSRFPVVGSRSRAPTQSEVATDNIENERELLLDPCRNNPLRHLLFLDNGTVAAAPKKTLPDSEKHFRKHSRGVVTIDTYGLNREPLVRARQDAAQSLDLALRFLFQTTGAAENHISALDLIVKVLAPTTPYLAMKIQVLTRWYLEHRKSLLPIVERAIAAQLSSFDPDFSPSVANPSSAPVNMAETSRSAAQIEQVEHEEQIKSASVEDDSATDAYFARASYISRVEVEGLASIEDCEFDVTSPHTESATGAPWLMLLGENGVGKTTLLKAIALALMGPRRLKAMQKHQSFRNSCKQFRNGSKVRVFLTSQTEPIELLCRSDKLVHAGGAHGSKVILRGFGPSRWFPLSASSSTESDSFVRINNLFDPFVALKAAGPFLNDLKPGEWRDVATRLKELLMLGEEGVIRRLKSGLVFQRPHGQRMYLNALSSGFETVVAMVADLAEMLFLRWDNLGTAEGVVLLDEIDAHLHPRWKMRIVKGLRAMFPRVQFIATTHEPLCLRGLRPGEILVLKRDDKGKGVVSVRPEESVDKLRVDQILTSRIFGLYSTLDPEYESELERYYELLSRHEQKRSDSELAELEHLRVIVGGHGPIGSSRRDQLIYQAIDEFVATESQLTPDIQPERERWTIDQVHQFWKRFQ